MEKTVSIPEGVSVEKKGSLLVVTGPKGSLERTLSTEKVILTIEKDAVRIASAVERRKVLAMTGTTAAHLKNMIAGVTNGFEAKLKVIYSHFPMKVKSEGDKVVIQNFLGGRAARSIEILKGVTVDVKKDDITISGMDREAVGQTAGRIEQITKVKGFDRRVFQDGIHLVQKTQEIA